MTLGSWWIVAACCLPAIALHILVNWKGRTALAFGNVIAHLGIILTLLFLEMTLQQTFVFLLISVTANMSIRTIVLKIREKKAEQADKLDVAQPNDAAKPVEVSAENAVVTEEVIKYVVNCYSCGATLRVTVGDVVYTCPKCNKMLRVRHGKEGKEVAGK